MFHRAFTPTVPATLFDLRGALSTSKLARAVPPESVVAAISNSALGGLLRDAGFQFPGRAELDPGQLDLAADLAQRGGELIALIARVTSLPHRPENVVDLAEGYDVMHQCMTFLKKLAKRGLDPYGIAVVGVLVAKRSEAANAKSFFAGLASYTTEEGRGRIAEVLRPQHTRSRRGSVAARLNDDYVAEVLHPNHLNLGLLKSAAPASTYTFFDRQAIVRDYGENGLDAPEVARVILEKLLEADPFVDGGVYNSEEDFFEDEVYFADGLLYATYFRAKDETISRWTRYRERLRTKGSGAWFQPPQPRRFDTLNFTDYADVITRGRGIVEFNCMNLYVLSMENRLYCFSPNSMHSRGQGGMTVKGAGCIVATEGKVLALDNRSGHYRPTWEHLAQVCRVMQAQGVLHQDAVVGHMAPKGEVMYFKAEDFIRLADQSMDPTAVRRVIARYVDSFGARDGIPIEVMHRHPTAFSARLHEEYGSAEGPLFNYLISLNPLNAFDGQQLQAVQDLLFSKVPSFQNWKSTSSAGLFASRSGAISQIDTALRDYDSVRQISRPHLKVPGVQTHDALIRLKTAALKLQQAIAAWLGAKHTAMQTGASKRGDRVVELNYFVQEEILRIRLALGEMRRGDYQRFAAQRIRTY